MTKVVRPSAGGVQARLMRASVSVSRALVASSRSRIGSVLEEGAGDGEALALAAGERLAALADDEVVAAGLAHDEPVRLGAAGGVLDLGVGGVGLADAQVLADRAVEQAGVLEHHGHGVAERGQGEPRGCPCRRAGCGRVGVAQALEEGQRRGLAGAGGADQGHGLGRARP